MNPKSIDTSGALQFGWDTLRAHISFFLKLLVVLIVASIIPAMIFAKIAQALGGFLGVPVQIINLVWQSLLGMGVLKICLKMADQQPGELSDLWSGLPHLLDYVVVKLAVALIVSAGLVLLIIPGLIWAMQFYFANYLVVDKNLSIMDALKGSSQLTKGVKGSLGIFVTVLFVLNILGALLLGVGLLVTIPISMLAGVHVYRQLQAQTQGTV